MEIVRLFIIIFLYHLDFGNLFEQKEILTDADINQIHTTQSKWKITYLNVSDPYLNLSFHVALGVSMKIFNLRYPFLRKMRSMNIV